MSNTQLEKQFNCFDCKNQIKLKRKDDDSGWLRFNLDGTEHNCTSQKKKFSKQSQDLSEVKTLLQQILCRLDDIERQNGGCNKA